MKDLVIGVLGGMGTLCHYQPFQAVCRGFSSGERMGEAAYYH